MNEEPPSSGAGPQPEITPPEAAVEPVTVEDVATAPSAAPPRRSMGIVLPAFLAVILATVVGAGVYFAAGGGGSSSANDHAPGVIDGFFRLGPSSTDNIQSFKGKAPPSFPTEFPILKGAAPIAGFAVVSSPSGGTTSSSSSKGISYFVIYSTSASSDDVYNFYLDALGKDPWQVEVARLGAEFTGVQFSRPDDPDIQGDVSIHHSVLDNQTVLYVSLQDLTPDKSALTQTKATVPTTSRPLPKGFPTSDVPIYKSSKGDSVISDTYFQKDPGSTSYVVSFLTKDSPSTVSDYYKGEFQKKSWNVTDSQSGNSGFAVSIDFTDGKSAVQGTVRADAFKGDSDYTKVDLLLQVSTNRSRTGN